MRYRTFYVSHSKDGFQLHLTDRSLFRDAVVTVAEWVCGITGHRGCNTWLTSIMVWSDKEERVLVRRSIDKPTAVAVAYSDDAWGWVDEKESKA